MPTVQYDAVIHAFLPDVWHSKQNWTARCCCVSTGYWTRV